MTKLDDVAHIGGVTPKPPAPQKVTRKDMSAIVSWHPKPVRQALKGLAAEEGTTVQNLMKEAINMLFANRGKGPIA